MEVETMDDMGIRCRMMPTKTGGYLGRGAGRYSDMFIFVPEMRQIIHISEGDGSNLLPEDIGDGYVDYIYYGQYEVEEGMPEVDGGQILLKGPLRDRYHCLAECIPDVLEMAYGCQAGFIILA